MIHYSFEQIDQLAGRLAGFIEEVHPNYNILTFVRGGTWASAFVAQHLSWKPEILSVHPTIGTAALLDMFRNKEPFFFLDDLIDTGKNVMEFLDRNCAIYFSLYFLFDKQCSNRLFTPKEFIAAESIVTDDWIHFPWEHEDDIP